MNNRIIEIFAAYVAISFSGCSVGDRNTYPVIQDKNQRMRLTEIAIAEVARREKWADMRLEVSIERSNDGWECTVWRLPKTPGGYRLVKISNNRKVTSYAKGR